MTEKAIFNARCVVYYFDSQKKTWTPTAVGQEFCRVDMYENSANGTYRAIGRGMADTSKVVINSNIVKDTQYTRASDTFHQWSDNRYIYGLNFGSKEEADNFSNGFEGVISKLKGGSTPVPAPAPAPPKQTASSPSTPPAAPSPPPAPAAPAAPPAPKVSSGGTEGRGALLASIQGFNTSKLKKTQTTDKSAPTVSKESSSSSGGSSSSGSSGSSSSPAGPMDIMGGVLAQRNRILANKKATPSSSPARPPSTEPSNPRATFKKSTPVPHSNPSRQALNTSGGSGNSSKVSNAELNALKEEILSEVRKEIQQMKNEILEALKK